MEIDAIQVQRKPPPRGPEGPIPGDELAGIRGRAGALFNLTYTGMNLRNFHSANRQPTQCHEAVHQAEQVGIATTSVAVG